MEILSYIDRGARICGGVVLALSSLACQPNAMYHSVTSTTAESTTSSAALPQDVLYAYPDLARLVISERRILKINSDYVDWINASNDKLNLDAFSAMITFLQQLSSKDIKLIYSNSGVNLDLSVRPRTRNRRYWLLLPETAQKPAWAHNDRATLGNGFTLENDNASITFIKIVESDSEFTRSLIFTTRRQNVSKTVNTEACQSWIDVTDKNPQSTHTGQELVCNSLASAMTLRQSGKSYPEYTGLMRSTTMYIGSERLPFIIIPDTVYNSIPNVSLYI